MEKKKIIIFGASSKTADAIIRLLSVETNYQLYLFSTNWKIKDFYPNHSCDNISLLNLKELKNVVYKIKPDVIINTSSINDVHYCETQKKLSWDINVLAVENLVAVSRVTDAHLIHFSCDSVFDGTKGPYYEKDLPNPINYYGKTKHASENTCLANHHKSTIIRTSYIFGTSYFGKLDYFTNNINIIQKNNNVYVPNDIICNPVYLYDVAIGVLKVINKKRYGIYHFGGSDWLSLYDLMLICAKMFEVDTKKIVSTSSSKLYNNLKIPKKVGLVILKSETDLVMRFSSFENGLLSYKRFQNNMTVIEAK